MKKLNQFTGLVLAAGLAFTAGQVNAQTKWDLPSAYPATNFHTENLTQFAADVDKATAGKLKITIARSGDSQSNQIAASQR